MYVLLKGVISNDLEWQRNIQQVRQQDAYPANPGGGSYNNVQHARPLFTGTISVADCMPLSSLLKTIKITGGVEFRRCMKNRDSCRITAGSNVPSTLERYASDCVDRRRAVYKCRSATHQRRSRLSHAKILKKCNTFLLVMDSFGILPRDFTSYILESSRRADIELLLTRNAVTYRFRDDRCQVASSVSKRAKVVHSKPCFDPEFGDT